MAALRQIAVLGSTGSIGRQALEVVERASSVFGVRSLAAHSNVDLVAAQIARFRPQRVAMVEARSADELQRRCPDVEVLHGDDGVVELASDAGADVVLNAVVGAAGLRATLAALGAGRRVALANKESCVAGGPLVADQLASGDGYLVPVDSEHASVHMCLGATGTADVRSLVLTASGGPFRGRTREDLTGVTASDALAHPTWDMGAKITVDSATLMNKGLEVIEAHVLFGLGYDTIDVVCHPQSVIHCLLGYADGSWMAALGPPDMRVPIAYALGYPERPDWGPSTVNWATMVDLTFEPVDHETFPSVRLAIQAGRSGGTAPAVLNAANEVAVDAFLDGRLPFLGITEMVERVLEGADLVAHPTLADVLAADAWARERTVSFLSS